MYAGRNCIILCYYLGTEFFFFFFFFLFFSFLFHCDFRLFQRIGFMVVLSTGNIVEAEFDVNVTRHSVPSPKRQVICGDPAASTRAAPLSGVSRPPA